MKNLTALFLAPILWACAISTHAATGSAETGDVTVDTRSENADLSALTLSAGTLSPAFAGDTTTYTAEVANATTSVTVTPTCAEPNATIEARVIGGSFAPVASGSPSGSLALNVGANSVEIRVTAQNTSTTKTYTVTVTRAATTPSLTTAIQTAVTATSATLGGEVTADGGAIVTERGIVWATTPSPTTANTTVANGNGTGIFAATVSGLPVGTLVYVRAYATNSVGTDYGGEISFTTQSTNAGLSSLTLSSGSLSPIFAPGTTDYSVSVSNATAAISVTPTRSQANAAIEARVNGGSYAPVSSGSPSGPLSLNIGANTIEVRVTAQAGNTQIYTITVTRDKAAQNITFVTPGNRLANETINLSATGGDSTNPVTFVVTDGPATITNGTTLAFTGAGSVTITANQLGNDDYHAATPVARTFNVSKASATVNLSGLNKIFDGTSHAVGTSTVPEGLAVNVTYDGFLSPPTNAGSYAVVATIDDEIYEGSASGTLVVSKASQTILFSSPGDRVATDVVTLTATGGDSGNSVTFVVTDGPATITSGTTLAFTGAGAVTITASQAGDANYEPATPVARTFNVSKANATVNMSGLNKTYDGTPHAVGAATVPDGLAVSVTYDGLSAPPTNAGSYAVVATIDDEIYEGSASGTLVVSKASQTILFSNPGNRFATDTINLSASGGGSLNPVTFDVTAPGLLNGNTLTFSGAGDVTVTASQAGNANYFAAPDVAHTITVTEAGATVTLSNLHQVHDGTARIVTVTTSPPDLEVSLTYDGVTEAPTAIGSYAVSASITDPLYDGSAADTLVVDNPEVMSLLDGGSLPPLSGSEPLSVPTFELGRYELTQSLWNRVREWAVLNGYDLASVGQASAGDHPVHSVNWHDAIKWCNARTEWENATFGRFLAPAYRVAGAIHRSGEPDPTTINVDEATSGYRLPTAAEWEFGARGGLMGTGLIHAGSNDPDLVAWHAGNSTGAPVDLSDGRGTWPSGRKAPNELGLYDLSGNVAEWVGEAHPLVPGELLLLGGSWNSASAAGIIGQLESEAPSLRRPVNGFRVARSAAKAVAGAVDNDALTWNTGGVAPWFSQIGTNHDGEDAAESGAIDEGGESWIETSVTGPGNLGFHWKAASVDGDDVLSLAINGTDVATLSGTVDWQEETIEIPEGNSILRWTFTRSSPASAGTSRVWVDEVVYTTATDPVLSTAPVIDLTETSATLGGEVTDDGGRTVTARGIVWSEDPDPTLEASAFVLSGNGTGIFTVPVILPSGGTTYFARAYATNAIGTGYGETVVFTTDSSASFTDGVARFDDRIILPGGRQVFHFNLIGPRMVSLTTLGEVSLRAELYDGQGDLIASFDGDANIDLMELLYAGAYVLHVFRHDDGGEAGEFDLIVDATVEVTTRPDLAVGASQAGLSGVGLYSPAGQLLSLVSKKAKPVTAWMSLANRGSLPDIITARATGGNGLFNVAYFGPGNITAALVSGTFRTSEINEGDAPVSIRATVFPNKKKLTKKRGKRKVILRKTLTLLIQANSTFDTSTGDAVGIRVQTK